MAFCISNKHHDQPVGALIIVSYLAVGECPANTHSTTEPYISPFVGHLSSV